MFLFFCFVFFCLQEIEPATTTSTASTAVTPSTAITTRDNGEKGANQQQKLNEVQQLHQAPPRDIHQCPDCNARFAHRQSLSRHRREAHNRMVNAHREPCAVCGVRVGRGDAMLRHMAAAHPPFPRPLLYDEWEAPPPTDNPELDNLLQRYWPSITTRQRVRAVVDIVNIRVWKGELLGEVQHIDVWEKLVWAWHAVTVNAKVNCSVGCVLRHVTTGELRYFHSSENNASLFERPKLVANIANLRALWESVGDVDLEERARQRRPDTSWRVLVVTNLTFYVWKMRGLARVGAPPAQGLPNYLLNNKSLLAIDKCRGKIYDDNLCFFRCLALSLGCRCAAASECRCTARSLSAKRTRELYHQYRQRLGLSNDSTPFPGVQFKDLMTLEKLFDLKITVLEKKESGECLVVWNTQRSTGHPLVLNLYQGHFSWVKRINSFANAFVCEVCSRRYTRQNDLNHHKCSVGEQLRRSFPGGAWEASPTVFDKLSRFANLSVPKEFYPYRIAFDIEVILKKDDLPFETDKLQYIAQHSLLSVSYCSNIPGHTEPVCLVRSSGEESLQVARLVNKFVDEILECSATASQLMRRRYKAVLSKIDREIERLEKMEALYEQKKAQRKQAHQSFSSGTQAQKKKSHSLSLAKGQLESWLDVVPVLGFNSQRYDLNVLKPTLMRELASRDDLGFVVKRQNSMVCIETESLRFLDVCNFIAPGFSYRKYLAAFDCAEEKGYFPYEWMDDISKLECDTLPPREAFYSSLKGESLPESDYELCQRAWSDNNMSSMRDFLIWYNNLDVKPMLEAVAKQCAIYKTKGIDMLKDAISLPGLAIRWMFATIPSQPAPQEFDPSLLHRELRQSLPVMLLTNNESDLYQTIKDNLVGGPSIIFHRYHEKDVTNIRQRVYGQDSKPCKLIHGVDANALYLWCLMREMPTGLPRRFKRPVADSLYRCYTELGSRAARGWLEWESRVRGCRIRHRDNGGEIRLGDAGLPVDGFCSGSNTVFQFHGCRWHGHPCPSNPTANDKEDQGRRHKETLEKEDYIKSLGYRLVVMWECDWQAAVNEDREKKRFLAVLSRAAYPKQGEELSRNRWIERVRDGSFFGLIECDIVVPDCLKDKFSEMSPIFKNTLVGREQLGDNMRKLAEEKGYLNRASRMLIGSMRGDRVLLFSGLARWYLQHGMVITEIYELIQYYPRAVFKEFGESVSNARRAGDADPNKKILADTSKLIGNSCYGKTIVNKDKHREVIYVEGDSNASDLVSQARFDSMVDLSCSDLDGDNGEENDGFYEASMFKTQVGCRLLSFILN